MAAGTPMTDWLYEATGYIYYEPDRRKVRRELQEHLDDAALSLHEAGLDWDSAKAKAVESMGDSKEVGLLLRRVHKPWLGWIYRLASRLCIACLVFCFILLINNVWSGLSYEWDYLHREIPTGAELVNYPSTESFDGSYISLNPSGEVRCGDYTFQISEAILASHPEWETDMLCFVLSYSSPRFWLGKPILNDYLRAETDGGREYSIHYTYPNVPESLSEDTISCSNIYYLSDYYAMGERTFQPYYSSAARGEWVLSLPVETDARWVDIIYEFDRSFDIRIDLRKGGGNQ